MHFFLFIFQIFFFEFPGLLRYKVDFQSMQLDEEEVYDIYDIDDY